MASDWNRLLERLLDAPLTASEYRLALAIARQTLGYRRRSAYIGRAYLRTASGLHGRTVERARDGLAEAGLIRFESPGRGRGKRTKYELLLDAEKGRSHAAFSSADK